MATITLSLKNGCRSSLTGGVDNNNLVFKSLIGADVTFFALSVPLGIHYDSFHNIPSPRVKIIGAEFYDWMSFLSSNTCVCGMQYQIVPNLIF